MNTRMVRPKTELYWSEKIIPNKKIIRSYNSFPETFVEIGFPF